MDWFSSLYEIEKVKRLNILIITSSFRECQEIRKLIIDNNQIIQALNNKIITTDAEYSIMSISQEHARGRRVDQLILTSNLIDNKEILLYLVPLLHYSYVPQELQVQYIDI